MAIHHLDGRPINYKRPPKPTDMVLWSGKTTGGGKIVGSYRTIAWLDHIAWLVKRRFGVELQVIQACFHTGVDASAGTHDYDCCFDVWIPGVDPWRQQRFFRANGAGGWYRHAPLFSNHIHLFVLPPREGRSISDDFRVFGFKVGIYVDGGYSTRGRLVTSSQIADYYAHAFGLSNQHVPNSDKSWFPKDIEATIFKLDVLTANRARRAA